MVLHSLSLRTLRLVILSAAKNLAQSKHRDVVLEIASGLVPLAMTMRGRRDCHGTLCLAMTTNNLEIITSAEVQNEGKL
jgi:hypothetical protein